MPLVLRVEKLLLAGEARGVSEVEKALNKPVLVGGPDPEGSPAVGRDMTSLGRNEYLTWGSIEGVLY